MQGFVAKTNKNSIIKSYNEKPITRSFLFFVGEQLLISNSCHIQVIYVFKWLPDKNSIEPSWIAIYF